ncbi:MAG: 1-acyl-sn-glycerol-3-phosphate acyltransferase [Chloroflexi bacterium]|nr:1-acyl-sn-glycerol-3-phosphate acyltransferase [Chloroflexota bacterium]
MDVAGAECVPPFGPLIIVSNHLSLNDPPLLVAAIPRPLFFIGKQELFKNPIARVLMQAFNVSPFDRSSAGIDAVRVLMQNLERDRSVVIFPEGTRSRDGTLQKGMLGVIYLALKSQAPILPVAVTGTNTFPLWRIPFPLKRMKANIGQPFTLPMIEGTPSRAVMNSMLDMVMGRIAEQLPPELRGVYGDNKTNKATEQTI